MSFNNVNNCIKFLTLQVILFGICCKSNTCYSREDIKPNINTINVNNNICNMEYMHLFDEDYNRGYYNEINTECIKTINTKKPEYKIFIKQLSNIFDAILTSIQYIEYLYYDMSQFLNNEFLPKIQLKEYAKYFDNFSFRTDILNNNKLNISQYLSNKDSTPFLKHIDFINYIKNSIRKLEAQTLKALEKSIFSTMLNINDNNIQIIKNSQLILTNVAQLFYKKINDFRNSKSNKNMQYLLHCWDNFRRKTQLFDVFFYNGSILQNRFNNLHNKIIAILDNVITDINTLKTKNPKVFDIKNVRDAYNSLIQNTTFAPLQQNLFDDFYGNNTNLSLSEYLTKLRNKLHVVKQITEERIQNEINTNNVVLSGKYATIKQYITIAHKMIHQLNNTKNKKLIQCADFIRAFGKYYDCYYNDCNIDLHDIKPHYIIEYKIGEFPQDIFEQVIDQNDNSFNLINTQTNIDDLQLYKHLSGQGLADKYYIDLIDMLYDY